MSGNSVKWWRFQVEVDGVLIPAVDEVERMALHLEKGEAVRFDDVLEFDVVDSGTDPEFWGWVRRLSDDPDGERMALLEVTLEDGRKIEFPNPRLLWLADGPEFFSDPVDLTGYPILLPVVAVELKPLRDAGAALVHGEDGEGGGQ